MKIQIKKTKEEIRIKGKKKIINKSKINKLSNYKIILCNKKKILFNFLCKNF